MGKVRAFFSLWSLAGRWHSAQQPMSFLQRYCFAGAGHWVHADQPQAVISALLDFVGGEAGLS